VRTAIITPSSDDTLIALTTDLEVLSDQLSDESVDHVEAKVVARQVERLAERARDLVPRFAWHVVGMKDGSALSPDVISLAKRLQAQRGELSDEARQALRSHRRGPEPELEPAPDPVAVRRERLSDQLSDGEGREVLQARRAGHGGRRAKRSDQAAQSA
jgi:hypothetical protein